MDQIKQLLNLHLTTEEIESLPDDIETFARMVRSSLVVTSKKPGYGPAVDKGKRGEKYVRDILAQYAPVATGRNHMGDITIDGILIEVKDRGTMPKTELTKFLRDMRTAGRAAGLFVSLSCPIPGMRTVQHSVETINGQSVPIMYVSSNDPTIIQLAAEVLIVMIRRPVFMHNQYVLSEDLQLRIEAIFELINKSQDTRESLRKMRGVVDSAVNDATQNLCEIEATIRAQVGSLRGQYADTPKITTDDYVRIFRERMRVKWGNIADGSDKIIDALCIPGYINHEWVSHTNSICKGPFTLTDNHNSLIFKHNLTTYTICMHGDAGMRVEQALNSISEYSSSPFNSEKK